MSTHAERENESAKKHGDKLDPLLKQLDGDGSGAGTDPIPMPENGSHERSHAAHLGGTVHERTKRAGDLRKSVDPGERREPPMDIRRAGKSHRSQ